MFLTTLRIKTPNLTFNKLFHITFILKPAQAHFEIANTVRDQILRQNVIFRLQRKFALTVCSYEFVFAASYNQDLKDNEKSVLPPGTPEEFSDHVILT